MTKSKTKLITGKLKGTVKRSVIRKAVEEVFGKQAAAGKKSMAKL